MLYFANGIKVKEYIMEINKMSSSPIPLAEDTIPLAGSVIPLAEDTIPLAEKSDSSSSDTQKTGRIRSNDIEEVQNKILDFCSEAKGMREIADWLGYYDLF